MKPHLLLDTNICIWMIDDELPPRAEAALTEAYNDGLTTYVSPITALEVATLTRMHRFKSRLPPERWFARLLGLPGMALAPMPPEVLMASQLLPGDIHNDPADRIFAATAREYGYALLTSDRALLDYGAQGYLAVIAC